MMRPSTGPMNCTPLFPPGPVEWGHILRAFEGYGVVKVSIGAPRGVRAGRSPQTRFYFFTSNAEGFPAGWWDDAAANSGAYENVYRLIEVVGGCMTNWKALFLGQEEVKETDKKEKMRKREKGREKDTSEKKRRRTTVKAEETQPPTHNEETHVDPVVKFRLFFAEVGLCGR